MAVSQGGNQGAGESQPFRRRHFDVVSLETLDQRVAALEEGMEAFRHDLGEAVREIQANTALTEDIHGDTADIVEVMSDIKVMVKWGKRLWRPMLVFVGFIGASLVYMKTGEWHWPK